MNKIESIKVVAIPDTNPDITCFGEYTDDIGPGVVVRHYGEFYEKIPTEMERDYDGKFMGKAEPWIPSKGREYRGFRPCAGDEEVGTKEYYEYGMLGYERREGLNNGDWYFLGIMAEAEVSYEVVSGDRRLETLISGGLWGIESDSGHYLEEVKKAELADLKQHLEKFNVDTSNWDELVKDLEIEYK